MKIREIIEKNLPLSVKSVKPSAIKTILYGNNVSKNKSSNTKHYIGLLFCESMDMDVNNPNINLKLRDDFIETARSYTGSKESIVNVLMHIKKILLTEGIMVDLEKPNFNYSNQIERQIHLIKFFHPDENHSLGDAENELWMYNKEKLIDDINDISYGNLSFLGNRIKLNYDRNNDEISCSSTGHPIIMVENLTQIIVQLEGLRMMAKGPMKEYAIATIRTILNQLSDYALERIEYVLDNLVGVDSSFYFDIIDGEEDLFFDENKCSSIKGVGAALSFLKNNKNFYIAYKQGDKTAIRYCKFNRYTGFEYLDLVDLNTDESFLVQGEEVICAAESKQEFYSYLS